MSAEQEKEMLESLKSIALSLNKLALYVQLVAQQKLNVAVPYPLEHQPLRR